MIQKEQQLQIGNVVTLNSGSPEMTVMNTEIISNIRRAYVTWIVGTEVQSAWFPEICLTRRML